MEGFGSGVEVEAVAVSPIVPCWVGVTTRSTVAWAPEARSPRSHVTTPRSSEHDPWLGVADTKFTPAGSVSLTCTDVASEGPLFVTVREYVRSWPTVTGS